MAETLPQPIPIAIELPPNAPVVSPEDRRRNRQGAAGEIVDAMHDLSQAHAAHNDRTVQAGPYLADPQQRAAAERVLNGTRGVRDGAAQRLHDALHRAPDTGSALEVISHQIDAIDDRSQQLIAIRTGHEQTTTRRDAETRHALGGMYVGAQDRAAERHDREQELAARPAPVQGRFTSDKRWGRQERKRGEALELEERERAARERSATSRDLLSASRSSLSGAAARLNQRRAAVTAQSWTLQETVHQGNQQQDYGEQLQSLRDELAASYNDRLQEIQNTTNSANVILQAWEYGEVGSTDMRIGFQESITEAIAALGELNLEDRNYPELARTINVLRYRAEDRGLMSGTPLSQSAEYQPDGAIQITDQSGNVVLIFEDGSTARNEDDQTEDGSSIAIRRTTAGELYVNPGTETHIATPDTERALRADIDTLLGEYYQARDLWDTLRSPQARVQAENTLATLEVFMDKEITANIAEIAQREAAVVEAEQRLAGLTETHAAADAARVRVSQEIANLRAETDQLRAIRDDQIAVRNSVAHRAAHLDARQTTTRQKAEQQTARNGSFLSRIRSRETPGGPGTSSIHPDGSVSRYTTMNGLTGLWRITADGSAEYTADGSSAPVQYLASGQPA